MAYFIGINIAPGVVDQPASVATSTQTKDVELNINATNVTDKETALLALEKIQLAIVMGTWPPV